VFFACYSIQEVADFNRLAHTELRLILAKMVYDFDIELANEVTEWLESAKFFVSSYCLDADEFAD
jgi:hypothetical protein